MFQALEFRHLLLLHLVFTFAMVGLMSTVQLVVYPQYREVPIEVFSDYVSKHGVRIGLPLVLFAPAEVLLALVVWLRAPSGTTKTILFISGALLAIAWVATMAWFAPLHGRLTSEAYDPERITQLINTNWVRTILWWLRGIIAVVVMWDLSRL